MNFLRYTLLTLHILGAAAIVGPAFEQLRSEAKRITTVMVWGARAQLVTGLALVGVAYANDHDPDHVKIAVKLLITLAVLGIAEATRKEDPMPWAFWSVFGLTIVNIVVAVAWH
ncbi:hypothetical protein [Demequina sp.]|uniref:hypothetical protein n=1 Tax=Demequina sp. TaxID=2050685 RepID=UPI003D13DBB0